MIRALLIPTEAATRDFLHELKEFVYRLLVGISIGFV